MTDNSLEPVVALTRVPVYPVRLAADDILIPSLLHDEVLQALKSEIETQESNSNAVEYLNTMPNSLLGHMTAILNRIAFQQIRVDEDELLDTILLTHSFFTTSDELLAAIIEAYYDLSSGFVPDPDMNECEHNPYEKAVICILEFWLTHHETLLNDVLQHIRMFYNIIRPKSSSSTTITTTMTTSPSASLSSSLNASASSAHDYDIVEACSNKAQFRRRSTAKILAISTSSSSSNIPNLDCVSPIIIAQHLTALDLVSFRRITPSAIANSIRNGGAETTIVQSYNNIANWVVSSILAGKDATSRVAIIQRFMEIIEHLKEQHNYISLTGFAIGFTHPALTRLSETLESLPSSLTNEIAKLQSLLFTPLEENVIYRTDLLRQLKTFPSREVFLPSVSIHCEAIASYDARNPSFSSNNIINIRKLDELYKLLNEFLLFRTQTLPFSTDSRILDLLSGVLRQNVNDDELIELSKELEQDSQQNNRQNSDVQYRHRLRKSLCGSKQFDEWSYSFENAALLVQLDSIGHSCPNLTDFGFAEIAIIIYKLAADIVHEHGDGNEISREEFKQLCEKVPDFGTFEDVAGDSNKITKHQLSIYLKEIAIMSARRTFPHNFEKINALKNTSCDQCKKQLYGITSRTAFKCLDCNKLVHPKCSFFGNSDCGGISQRGNLSRSRSTRSAASDGWTDSKELKRIIVALQAQVKQRDHEIELLKLENERWRLKASLAATSFDPASLRPPHQDGDSRGSSPTFGLAADDCRKRRLAKRRTDQSLALVKDS